MSPEVKMVPARWRERDMCMCFMTVCMKRYIYAFIFLLLLPLCVSIYYIYISCHNFLMIIIITRKIWVEAKKSKQQLPEVEKEKKEKKRDYYSAIQNSALWNGAFQPCKSILPLLAVEVAISLPPALTCCFTVVLYWPSPCEVGLCMPVQVDESITCFHGELKAQH